MIIVDPRIEDALARLVDLDSLPLGEHAEVFAEVHARFAAVLAAPDSRG